MNSFSLEKIFLYFPSLSMKFSKLIFICSLSLFLLFGLISYVVSQDQALEAKGFPQRVLRPSCEHADGQFCFLYGIQENANTRIPPPQLAKRRGRNRVVKTAQSSFVVTYTGFTPEARAAFQYAVDIWASFIQSPVPIRINAEFINFGGSFSLGYARSLNQFSPTSEELWHPVALANKIAERDLDVFGFDMEVTLNNHANVGWYFGTNGNTPAGQFDFVTVVLHEIGHGLGFYSEANDTFDVNHPVMATMGKLRSGTPRYPYIYDSFVVNGSGTAITSFDDPSADLLTQYTSGNLFWDGTQGKAENDGSRPKLYAPSPWRPGASYWHLDENTYPAGDVNSLMTPGIRGAESTHHPGPIMLGMLEDMGWTINTPPAFATETITRSVAENTAAGVNIGDVVSATDEDKNDTLTYSLRGTDATSFAIESTTGQLRTLAALNYEVKDAYTLTVVVDDDVAEDTIEVTINITDVNDPPMFPTDSTTLEIVEGTSANQNIGIPVVATDEDPDDPALTYSLGGTDAGSFSIDEGTGQLKTKSVLNYDTQSSYEITVIATGSENLTGSISVSINVIKIVAFTDTALVSAVRSALGIASGASILSNTLASLTSLTASADSISDLTGLEYATGLTSLDLSDNEIVNLSPLEDLSNLETLDLSDNDIVNLRYIKDLSSLETLNLSGNDIVNLSHLSGLSSLETLDLSDNEIIDVSSLQDMDSLTTLDLSGNTGITNPDELYHLEQGGTTITLPPGIEIPDAVAFTDANLETAVKSALGIASADPVLETDITTLTSFTATRKGIVNLIGLEKATGLTTLDLGNNSIVNLNPLSGLSRLKRLDLDANEIENVVPLRNLSSLERLDLDANEIENVSALSGLSSLKRLELRDNDIMDAKPLSTMTHLTHLYLSGNENLTNVKYLVKLTDTTIDIDLPDPVNVPDTNLASALRTALSIPSGDSIFPEDMETLTTFTASNKSIVTLTGLEKAMGLTTLDLGDNSIVNLSPLSGLTSLTRLDLADNDIENVAHLSNLSNLERLDLDANEIENVSSLSGLSSLKRLELRDNDILDAKPLSSMTHLTHLYLRGNDNLSNIKYLVKLTTTTVDIDLPDPVSIPDTNLASALRSALSIPTSDAIFREEMETLTTFSASNKSIVRLTGLEAATELTSLTLSENDIVNLSPLEDLSNLETLDLSYNDIVDLRYLKDLGSLETLDLSENDIVNLSHLSGLSSFETLDLSDNEITDVSPLRDMSSLTTLDMSGNTGITNPEELYYLEQGGTSITLPDGIEIPDAVVFTDDNLETAVKSALRIASADPVLETDITTLTSFTATRKSIVNLTGLEKATSLTSLDLGNNAIVDLSPLSGLTRLTSLDLAYNQIVVLSPLSGLTSLASLYLDKNKIENVSALSSVSSLTRLDLRNNDVMDARPLSTMTHLTHLYLAGNDNLSNIKYLVKLTTTTVDIDLPDPVSIPDTNLASALRSALSIPISDAIFPEEMETLTTFSASNKSIVRLTGLEKATALTSLTLSENDIVNLSPLSKLNSLETLDLSDNDIVDLRYLRDLIGLETLNLSDNDIVNLSNISVLSVLTDLNLSNNSITNVTALSGLTNLTLLNLTGNSGITNPGALYGLKQSGTTIIGVDVPDAVEFPDTNLASAVRIALRIATVDPILEDVLATLTRLTATRKSIVNLTGLEQATGLTTLDLGDNAIINLNPLLGLTTLTTLDLADNEIENVSALQNLRNLESLDLDGNEIENVSALSGLSRLTSLELRDNDIGDVTSLSTMTHLTHLYLRGNESLTNIKRLLNLTSTTVDIVLPDAVDILDTNLASALRSALGLLTDDPILPEEIEQLTNLTVSGRNIADLTGLETATGLTNLTLSNNAIVDLDPLSDLTRLTDLNLSDNQIEDLTPLEALTSLQTLDLRNNLITDVAPLAELTSLTLLQLAGNSITNPGALYRLKRDGTTITGVVIPDDVVFDDANLEAAVKLALRIADTAPILPDEMATLTRLTASNKSITSLGGLEDAGRLETLDVGQNEISDLTPLTGLTNLEVLDLADNGITNISALSNLANLERLDLQNNDVTDTALLSDMTHLRYLYVRGNENLASLKELVKLKEAGTVVDITLPKPVNIPDDNLKDALQIALSLETDDPIFPEDMLNLQTFEASNPVDGEEIVTLTGLETATNLTRLNLSGNEISSISLVSKLTRLTDLNLSGNQISSISSLSGLTRLTDLNLSSNRISSVSSLSRLTGLTALNLSINTISSVSSLSNLISLTSLDLSTNRVTNVLPLQVLSSLRTLNLLGNAGITNIEVLYKLQQGGTNITPPTNMRVPTDADIVSFNNAALETAVRSALRISTGYPVLKRKISELARLTVTHKEIVDLIGLEEATNLTTLDLGNNAIVNLSPLQNLSSLVKLDLADNAITEFTALTGLSILVDLDLDGNEIVSLPENLTGLSSLVTLDLADNNIENVLSLSGLSVLKTLDLRDNSSSDAKDNDVRDITPVSGLLLKALYLRGNENLINDLSASGQLSNARVLVKLKAIHRTSIDITLPRSVTFQDDNLVSLLRNRLRLESDDPIFPEEMETLTSFDASNPVDGEEIVTLTGLETATNLTSLNLSGNEISSLSPLSSLANVQSRNNLGPLTDLDLSQNKISSISSLSNLTRLTDLDLSGNKISSVSSLSRLTRLTDLNLSTNTISSLTSLSNLINLTSLDLSTNGIRDVLPLQGLIHLQRLHLSGNDDLTEEKASVLYKLEQANPSITITLPGSITLPTNVVVFNNANLEAAVRSALRISTGYPVLKSKITELTRLIVTRKEIVDLTGLEEATGLTTLGLGQNAIENIGPLSSLTNLETLDLGQNAIKNIGPLSSLSRLVSLDLADNEIENVSSLSGLSGLKTLDLRDNSSSDAKDNDVGDATPLKDLTSLRNIYLHGNDNIRNLEWLGALVNLRSDIRLPDVVGIPDTNLDSAVRTALRIAGNTVSNDLPMSEELLESLETLTASNRSIEDLTGCEHMTGLTSLDLRNNQITDVTPLSRLYSLETLQVSGNGILDTSVLRELERRGTNIDITIYRYPFWDVNQDGSVDEEDVFLITLTITGESPDVNGDGSVDGDDETAADANKDGSVDTGDLLLVFEKQDRPVNLGAPLLSVGLDWELLERIDASRLRVQLDILRMTNDGTPQHQQVVVFLQTILVAIQPNQTLLLANYPNPLNPETWIPYQLARDSHVRITIYDMQGAIIRRLELGYRAEGYYRIRSRAAYWDGRNEIGERVASGIYFYQLETDDVSLLRKMVILK